MVRRAIGYRRYEGLEGARILPTLYEALRGYVNFFQPSFKLRSKERHDARVIKRYHPPATPCRRPEDDAHLDEPARAALRVQAQALDPIRLLQTIRSAQEQVVTHADGTARGPSASTRCRDAGRVFGRPEEGLGHRCVWQTDGRAAGNGASR
ncbi:hypothetical protein HUK84_02900 [Nguyenibacter vanlangensis]|uniref:Uncharacterized protein n=1 Tax=Nguyenibacter vanlangensis TaxID=1216886 RepID=A0A7Y7M5Q8_9PROT|nr:hypothetical protein [Nguyenibacter vanlangensis]